MTALDEWAADELLRRAGFRQVAPRRKNDPHCWIHPLDRNPNYTRHNAIADLKCALEHGTPWAVAALGARHE